MDEYKIVNEKILFNNENTNEQINFIDYHTNQNLSIDNLNFFYTTNKKRFGKYKSSKRIADEVSGEVFLDGASVIRTVSSYPYRAKFVYIRLKFNLFLIFSIVGIIRRILISSKRVNSTIELKGLTKVDLLGSISYWIKIQNINSLVPTNFTFGFSKNQNENITNLLITLNDENVDYVVLRFHEKLPYLFREDGDLDLLVSDDDWKRVKFYIESNQGKLKVDMYGVSTPAFRSMVSYMPPYLSDLILSRRVKLENDFYVPSNEDYINSFIFHCVIHKGYSSGIKSSRNHSSRVYKTDNDYNSHIKLIGSDKSELNGELSLESLYEYLKSVGWLPTRDTLSFYAFSNEWLGKHLKNLESNEEIGLNFMVIREFFFECFEISDIIIELNKLGCNIIHQVEVNETNLEFISKRLRGGNWGSLEYYMGNPLLPKYLIIFVDNNPDIKFLRKYLKSFNRIRLIKRNLRKRFNNSNYIYDSIHITDNTTEAIEYIDLICFSKAFEFKYKQETLEKEKLLILNIIYWFLRYEFNKLVIIIRSIFSRLV